MLHQALQARQPERPNVVFVVNNVVLFPLLWGFELQRNSKEENEYHGSFKSLDFPEVSL